MSGNTKELNRSLKLFPILMIGVGGTIGTGLFLGSGRILNDAGPGGMVVAYAFGALVMYLMMLILGELVTAMPNAGTVQVYTTEFISPSVGFLVGWVRWIAYGIIVPVQFVASTNIIGNYFPGVHPFVWPVLFAILIFCLNMVPAEKYGLFNIWFSSFKFILIIVFVLVGFATIFGFGAVDATGFSNITNDGGLFPNGMIAVVMSMMTAAFAYSGADLFAASASESANPEKDLPKAINATIIGLLIAYFASIVVIISILPWADASVNYSPFAQVFVRSGINAGFHIVNIIVITSALSSANAFAYSATRTLWSMANYGQAPKFCSKLSKGKVPINALLFVMFFAIVGAALRFLMPGGYAYLFLVGLTGSANTVLYMFYAISLLYFRKEYKKLGRDVKDLKFKSPLFPITPILSIILCLVLLGGMYWNPAQRESLLFGLVIYASLYFGRVIYVKIKGDSVNPPKTDNLIV